MKEIVHGDDRLASAANARFGLADRLARLRMSPSGNELTPGQLHATFRSLDRITSLDQALAEECRPASCRGLGPVAEARVLVEEAELVYRVIADRGGRFGYGDLMAAQERSELVLRQLPLG